LNPCVRAIDHLLIECPSNRGASLVYRTTPSRTSAEVFSVFSADAFVRTSLKAGYSCSGIDGVSSACWGNGRLATDHTGGEVAQEILAPRAHRLGTVVWALGKLRRGIVRPPIWTFRRRTLCGIGRRCEGRDSAGFPVERGHVAADLEAIRTRAFRAEAEAHRAVARRVADERLIPDDEPRFRLLRRVGPEWEHEIDNAEKLGASRIVCCRN